MSDTKKHDGDELPFGNGELESYESAERDGEGNLVPAPGARAAKTVNDAASQIGKELKGKVPMGPYLEDDDRSPEAEGIPVVDGVVQRHPKDDRSI